MKRALASLALALALGSFMLASAATTTVVVHPGDMQDWEFFSENQPGGSGSMVDGPGDPPSGTGSANLILTASDQGYVFGARILGGTPLADITELSYTTYRSVGSEFVAPALQFSIDYDLNDDNEGWQGRLTYEPYRTETVLDNEWQRWDALEGLWWASGAPGNTVCGQNTPCTWETVLQNWPDAGINPGDPQVLFKVGSGWDEFDGNIDSFTIGIGDDITLYDFELAPPPAGGSAIACLYSGGLSQVTEVENGTLPDLYCARGEAVTLQAGSDYWACLYAGTLSQFGATEPASCGRGELISFAAGDDLFGCAYAGRLSQVGYSSSLNCGRGEQVGLASVAVE